MSKTWLKALPIKAQNKRKKRKKEVEDWGRGGGLRSKLIGTTANWAARQMGNNLPERKLQRKHLGINK